jgi:Phage portal protein, lambda family
MAGTGSEFKILKAVTHKPNFFERVFLNKGKTTVVNKLPKVQFSGLHDAAITTLDRPFLGYWSTDAHFQISNYDLMRLRSDSRKLFANMGEIRAPVLQRTMYAFGANGWRPQFTGSNKDWGNKAVQLLESDILPALDVRGPMYSFQKSLALASNDIDKDGDILCLFTETDEGLPAIQWIPAHRIGQRTNERFIEEGEWAGCEMHHGVITRNQVPVAYQVMGDKAEDDTVFGVEDAMLVFEPEFNGFPRGVPAASFALNALKDMMVSQIYEQQALMLASHIGLLETNPEGGSDDYSAMIEQAERESTWYEAEGETSPPVNPKTLPPISTESLMGGVYKYFKSNTGSKLESFKSERPSGEWQAFMDRLTRQYCAGISYPFELAWSPEKAGGASIRLVVGQAQRAVETRQRLFLPVAKRIIKYAVSKLIDLKELEENDEWDAWGFSYPPEINVDAGRDERARADNYKLGILNLEEILTEEGKTLEHHLRQRVNETVLREKLALEAEKKYGIKIDRNELQALFANPVVETDSGAAKETPVTIPEGTPAPAPAPAPDKEAIRQAVGPYLGWGTETEELTEKLSQVIKAE